MFKIVNNMAPSYLREYAKQCSLLVVIVVASTAICRRQQLFIPRTRTTYLKALKRVFKAPDEVGQLLLT